MRKLTTILILLFPVIAAAQFPKLQWEQIEDADTSFIFGVANSSKVMVPSNEATFLNDESLPVIMGLDTVGGYNRLKWRSASGLGSSVGGFTEGSVIFAAPGGTLTEDNGNLFWDDTNDRLRVGATNANGTLNVDKNIILERGGTEYGSVNGYTAGGFSFLSYAANAYRDDSDLWQRFNTARYSTVIQMQTDPDEGYYRLFYAAPAANPIASFTQVFEIDEVGNMDVQGTIDAADKVTITKDITLLGGKWLEIDDGGNGSFSISEGSGAGGTATIPAFTATSSGASGFGFAIFGQIPTAQDTDAGDLTAAISMIAERSNSNDLLAANLFNIRNNNTTYFNIKTTGNAKFFGTGALTLHSGSVAQRPTPGGSGGEFRYNTDSNVLEYHNASDWQTVGTTAAGDNLGNHIATENLQMSGFWVSNDGGNEGVFVTTAGDVGIGTSSPSSLFHISGSNAFQTQDRAVDNVGGAGVTMQKARGTISSKTIVQSADNFGVLGFRGWDGAGWIDGAGISGQVDGTPGVNDMPGRIIFQTTPDGSATLVTRMTIKNDGKVGIGNTSPANNLHVGNATASSVQVGIQTALSTATPSYLDLGGDFANSAGDASKAKFRLFNNGASIYGIGVSAGNFEFHNPIAANTYTFYNAGASSFSLNDDDAAFTGTGSLTLHSGSVAQRPTPGGSGGEFRYNTDSNVLEYHNGSSWLTIANTSAGSGGIYGGSGSLPGNVTATMGANTLSFDGTGAWKAGDISAATNGTHIHVDDSAEDFLIKSTDVTTYINVSGGTAYIEIDDTGTSNGIYLEAAGGQFYNDSNSGGIRDKNSVLFYATGNTIPIILHHGYNEPATAVSGLVAELASDHSTTEFPVFSLQRSRMTSTTNYGVVQSGDMLGRLRVIGNYDLTGTSLSALSDKERTAGIDFLADENFGASARGSEIRIYNTTVGTTTRVNAIVIDSDNDITFTHNSGLATFSGTSALVVPKGTTGQRPTASGGEFRANNDTPTALTLEYHDGTGWQTVGTREYGNLYRTNGLSDSLKMTSGGSYYTIPFFTQGENYNTTLTDSTITIDETGTFEVSYSCEFTMLDGTIDLALVTFAVFDDDVIRAQTVRRTTRSSTSTTVYYNVSGDMVYAFSGTNVLKLKASGSFSPQNIKLGACSFTAKKIE